jgi:hypothetical protein
MHSQRLNFILTRSQSIVHALVISLTMTACGTTWASFESFCGGPNQLLSLADRPSFADSVCVVPHHSSIFELGYQNVKFTQDHFSGDFVQSALRVGLPQQTEVVAIFPNYTAIHRPSFSGFSEPSFSIKHAFASNDKFMFTAEAIYNSPGGNSEFGSQSGGVSAYAITALQLSKTLSLTTFTGVSSQSMPSSAGGQRYLYYVPDAVLSWSHDQFNLYAEVYGQSKTAYDQGFGVIWDAGILYLLNPSWMVDLEGGHSVVGLVNGVDYFLGMGTAILLDF